MADKPFSLRDEGRRRLLQALYDHGACGRPELIRFTSLSRTTVSSLVSELVVNGVVEERDDLPSEAGPRAIGRPAVAVSMAPTAGYAVGIDIGHQHVRVAVCDMLGHTVAESATVREVDLTPHETLDLAAARVHEALDERHISPSAVIGLGLGIAAPVQGETGEIEAAGIMPGWVGVNPAAELERRTALPVGVTNDADAGALGERTYGAARGVDDLIYVRLSAASAQASSPTGGRCTAARDWRANSATSESAPTGRSAAAATGAASRRWRARSQCLGCSARAGIDRSPGPTC